MELSGNVNNLSGDAAIAYLREQEAIRKARAKRRWITFGIVLASLFVLMVGCGIAVGAASGSSSNAAVAAPATPSLTGTVTAPSKPTAEPAAEPTATAPTTFPPGFDDRPVPPKPSEASSGLGTSFGNGQWAVGEAAEVAPGVYRSAGSDGTHATMGGYVSTEKADGTIIDFETSDATDSPLRITLHEGDTVTSKGCQEFTKVS
jgi:hypothetical protein